jgi:uncharacterized protein (TIGR02118 family)
MLNRRGFILGVSTSVGATTIIASRTVASETAKAPAISLNVVYLNHEGAKFDTAYYRSTHIPLAMKVLKADSVKLIEGVPNGSSAPPIAMIAYFEFASADALKAALADPAMAEVRADIPKFTDIKPTVMVGKSG